MVIYTHSFNFSLGADIEYAGQPHPYPYGFPNSETSIIITLEIIKINNSFRRENV